MGFDTLLLMLATLAVGARVGFVWRSKQLEGTKSYQVGWREGFNYGRLMGRVERNE